MREASSSANAKVRKFDANVVARTAVNTLRRNQNYMVSNLRKGGSSSCLDKKTSLTGRADLSVYTQAQGSGSGIPRPHSHSSTIKTSSKASMSTSLHMPGSNNDDDSRGGSGRGSNPSKDRRKSQGSTAFTTDFQAACRARAAKKHKELMARALQESTTLRERETRIQQSQRLKQEEAAVRDKVRHRTRAEV